MGMSASLKKQPKKKIVDLALAITEAECCGGSGWAAYVQTVNVLATRK